MVLPVSALHCGGLIFRFFTKSPCVGSYRHHTLHSCQHTTVSSKWSLLSMAACFGTCVPSSGKVFSYVYSVMLLTWVSHGNLVHKCIAV
jgi:hypothetical protein